MWTTTYHQDLLRDHERLAAFCEAIKIDAKGIVYDLGAGTGIFSIIAAPYSDFVYAIESDPTIAKCAERNLRSLQNVRVINEDVREVSLSQKADLMICEMLDTALIEEEQVRVLNSILKYLKKDGKIIPRGVLNSVEPVSMDAEHICYDEDDKISHEIMSELFIYGETYFKNNIKEEVDVEVELLINKSGTINGIKITTFTLLADGIICGPTSMLNPPLLVPANKIRVEEGDNIKLDLSYIMGGGLDSIRTKIEKISSKSRKNRHTGYR
jgi:predicted RNA methylase